MAAAAAIQSVEALVPSPFPGIKPGLANGFTLAVMEGLGPVAAFRVAMGRVVAAGMFLGTLFTPTFLMSLAGALCAFPLAVAGWWMGRRWRWGPGLAGVSVLSALGHVTGQLLVAWLLVVRGPEVLLWAPVLAVAACVTGWVTAGFAWAVLRARKMGGAAGVLGRAEAEGPERRISAVAGVLALCGMVFSVVGGLAVQVGVCAVAFVLWVLSDVRGLGKVLVGILPWAGVFVLVAVLGRREGRVVWGWGGLRVTLEGWARGAEAGLRLVALSLLGRLVFAAFPVRRWLGGLGRFGADVAEALAVLPSLVSEVRARVAASGGRVGAVVEYFGSFLGRP